MAEDKTPSNNEEPTLKAGSPKIDLVNDAIRLRVAQLTRTAKLTTPERSAMHQLAGYLSQRSEDDDKDMARLEYLLTFMEGDIDWRARYKEVFNIDPPTKQPRPPSSAELSRREQAVEET